MRQLQLSRSQEYDGSITSRSTRKSSERRQRPKRQPSSENHPKSAGPWSCNPFSGKRINSTLISDQPSKLLRRARRLRTERRGSPPSNLLNPIVQYKLRLLIPVSQRYKRHPCPQPHLRLPTTTLLPHSLLPSPSGRPPHSILRKSAKRLFSRKYDVRRQHVRIHHRLPLPVTRPSRPRILAKVCFALPGTKR